MPTVRTTCPTCDIVTLDAPELRVRLGSDGTGSEAAFVCPACHHEVVHPLSERMIPVLLGAGCPLDFDDDLDGDLEGDGIPGERLGERLADRYRPAAHPAFGLELTELEIEQFVAALNRTDWFDELAY